MAKLELEEGTDVLLLEDGDALLLEFLLPPRATMDVRSGAFSAYKPLIAAYVKSGRVPPANLLNRYFMGADGKFHRKGTFMGADGK